MIPVTDEHLIIYVYNLFYLIVRLTWEYMKYSTQIPEKQCLSN